MFAWRTVLSASGLIQTLMDSNEMQNFSELRQPQKEALVRARISSFSVWGGLRVISFNNFNFSSHSGSCHLKLPQHVALTEFKCQISAQIGEIRMTWTVDTNVNSVWSFYMDLFLIKRTETLPQQLALTVFTKQVSAHVKVMLVTSLPTILRTDKTFTRETTPKRSTYELKYHKCVRLRWSPCDEGICCLSNTGHRQPSHQ